ncbi:oligosaccharide flippase family protein [Paenibacillus sp. P96]|uniref:Oligosaccharide flippase family protein n=1 Tax=Paenibacillus zeirhizosphaerae TaxID=2987519 RepID=A0ABT9FWT2_9BACL|nr:oligosaccharide flippase family protein [Paenibacillus sp. P96]MDP4098952.1 oligosaccharide flippase family protein [Paenibacillus sp. P96]
MQYLQALSNPIRTVIGTIMRFARSKDNSSAAVKTMFFSILILLVNMLTGILTARYLGPTGRGEQAAMTNWSQFLAFCMTFGVPSALIYNAKKNPKDAGNLYGIALLLAIIFGGLASTVGVFLIPLWLDAFSPSVVLFAQLSMVMCPVIAISQINNAMMQVRGEYRQYNIFRYIVPLSTLALLGLLIITGYISPYTSALAYLLPSVPVYVVVTVRLIREYRPKIKNGWLHFKRLFSYGMGSYGNDLMGQVSIYIDQILIAALLAPAELGLYAVAVSLARMVSVFANSIIVVLFPKASSLEREDAIAITFRAFRITSTAAILTAIVLMLIAPFVFTLLYGPEFKEALTVFRLLVLEVSIGGGTMVLAQTFMALGKPKLVTILQGLGLALVVPLLIILVPAYGLTGAGIAMLSSVILRFICILFNVKFVLKTKIPRLIISRQDIQWLRKTMSNYIRRNPANG